MVRDSKDIDNKYLNGWEKNSPLIVRNKIKNLSQNEKEANFYSLLKFGTAGVRSTMAIGTNKLNKYTIAQLAYSYGLALKDIYGKKTSNGVVITHDNRKNGKLFSEITASVLIAMKIPAYLFKNNEMQPTPLLSFTIKNNRFVGGINITASHNPREYNGFKIYDKDGVQSDSKFIKIVEKYNSNNINNFEILKDKNFKYLDEKFVNIYIDKLINSFFTKKKLLDIQNKKSFNLVFTSNQGTSYKILTKIAKKLNVKIISVKEQNKPSTEFSNTPYPNPQDIKSFDLAKKYGIKYKANYLYGADPDADRYGFVIREKNGKWKVFDGNMVPAICLHWKINEMLEKNQDLKKYFVTTTWVSGNLAKNIADNYGVKVLNTYTGFRWIIHNTNKEAAKGKKPLMEWEESNGMTFGHLTGDKDTFQSFVMLVEVIKDLNEKGTTIDNYWKEIQKEYGKYNEYQIVHKFNQPNAIEIMNNLIEDFRKNFKDNFLGYKVIERIDFLTKKEKQNFLLYRFENGSRLIVRPSGTEPIIRFYNDWVILNKNDEELEKNITSKLKKYIKENYG